MGYYYNRYYKDISTNWNWEAIKKEARNNCILDEENQIIGQCYLGSVMGLYTSGKYYMPWCTNQTVRDVIKDEAFSEALEKIANDNGMFVTCGEGDPCDVYLGMFIELEEMHNFKDGGITFVTQEDYDTALELFSEGD